MRGERRMADEVKKVIRKTRILTKVKTNEEVKTKEECSLIRNMAVESAC